MIPTHLISIKSPPITWFNEEEGLCLSSPLDVYTESQSLNHHYTQVGCWFPSKRSGFFLLLQLTMWLWATRNEWQVLNPPFLKWINLRWWSTPYTPRHLRNNFQRQVWEDSRQQYGFSPSHPCTVQFSALCKQRSTSEGWSGRGGQRHKPEFTL